MPAVTNLPLPPPPVRCMLYDGLTRQEANRKSREKWREAAANPHRSSPPPFSFSISPFTSLSYHPLLITGTEWAALLPKWLMGSTLYCPLWEGPSGQNYAVWDPHWVVMTGYGSACCPCCFQGHFIQVREKNGALRRSSCKSSAVRHRTETRGGGASIIYHKGKSRNPSGSGLTG